ncbi:hypothetical protein C8R43DRAFT_888405, partial [Mycena crocata]
DSFELFDLRVEAICPPGERILCGAKEGDHFTLEGEMPHLPRHLPPANAATGVLCIFSGYDILTWLLLAQVRVFNFKAQFFLYWPRSSGRRIQRLEVDGCGRCMPRPTM